MHEAKSVNIHYSSITLYKGQQEGLKGLEKNSKPF